MVKKADRSTHSQSLLVALAVVWFLTSPASALDRERLEACRESLSPLVDFDGTPEQIWLEWYDRPYARASLAMAYTAYHLLEQSPAEDTAGTDAVMAWLEKLPSRIRKDRRMRQSFRPTSKPSLIIAVRDELDAPPITDKFGSMTIFAAAGIGGIIAHLADVDPAVASAFAARATHLGIPFVISASDAESFCAKEFVDSDGVPGQWTQILADCLWVALKATKSNLDPVSKGPQRLPTAFCDWNPTAPSEFTDPNSAAQLEDSTARLNAALWMAAVSGVEIVELNGWRTKTSAGETFENHALLHPVRWESIAHTQ
ncbi:MAG: hypothetical protein ACPGXK_10905, partial [Phycisphaerae bacterium]